jgi:hypothetical protein
MNDFTTSSPFDENKVYASELYDYDADPLEKQNVFNDKAYSKISTEMRTKMLEFFKSQEKK